MYTLAEHGRMLADRVRIDAYHRAMARAIRPDSVVLDIGAGTGVLSLLACRLGARRVIAVEPAAVIGLARKIAGANGCLDRIEFIQALSTAVALPEPADVIVSDARGVLPFYQRHIPDIIDARARLLAPGGVLIPRTDTLWAAPVEAPAVYDRVIEPWTEIHGIDLRPAQSHAVNLWVKTSVVPEQLLAAPEQWATITYETVTDAGARAQLRFEAGRAGTIHGFAAWFDADLGNGVHVSNAPDKPEMIYGHAFFPLIAPVTVEPGDVLTLDLRADLVGDDYVWQWATRVSEPGGPRRIKADYRQSTFWGEPLAAGSLRRRAASFVPRLTADAAIDRVILSLMDGHMTSGDIARNLAASFPDRFPTWEDALARVGRVSLECSE